MLLDRLVYTIYILTIQFRVEINEWVKREMEGLAYLVEVALRFLAVFAIY